MWIPFPAIKKGRRSQVWRRSDCFGNVVAAVAAVRRCAVEM